MKSWLKEVFISLFIQLLVLNNSRSIGKLCLKRKKNMWFDRYLLTFKSNWLIFFLIWTLSRPGSFVLNWYIHIFSCFPRAVAVANRKVHPFCVYWQRSLRFGSWSLLWASKSTFRALDWPFIAGTVTLGSHHSQRTRGQRDSRQTKGFKKRKKWHTNTSDRTGIVTRYAIDLEWRAGGQTKHGYGYRST